MLMKVSSRKKKKEKEKKAGSAPAVSGLKRGSVKFLGSAFDFCPSGWTILRTRVTSPCIVIFGTSDVGLSLELGAYNVSSRELAIVVTYYK